MAMSFSIGGSQGLIPAQAGIMLSGSLHSARIDVSHYVQMYSYSYAYHAVTVYLQ